MRSEAMLIENSEAVVSVFGYWPAFHDANVLSLVVSETSASLALTLHVWEMTNDVDEQGYFILRKHHLVSLKFEAVSQLQIRDFAIPNILHCFSIQTASEQA